MLYMDYERIDMYYVYFTGVKRLGMTKNTPRAPRANK